MYKVDLGRVYKDFYQLPRHIITKLQRWVEGVEKNAIEEMRKIPGFHDEPLKGERKGYRSIRLNKAYRAIYYEKFDAPIFVIVIIEVNKNDY